MAALKYFVLPKTIISPGGRALVVRRLRNLYFTQDGCYRVFLWSLKIRTIAIIVFQFRVVAGTP